MPLQPERTLPALTSRKADGFLMAGLILLAFLLRVRGIDWGIPSGEHWAASFISDEYTVFHWMRQMDPARSSFNPHAYLAGTLLVYVLAGFYKLLALAGAVTLASDPVFYYQNVSEWGKFFRWGRLLMVAVNTAAIAILYRAVSEALGRARGFIAALLLAVIPLGVVLGKFLLVETFGMLWVCLFLLFAFRVLRRSSRRDYLAMGLVLGTAGAVKIIYLLLIPIFLLAHVLRPRSEKSIGILLKDRFLWAAGALAVISYFLFNPYFLYNLREAAGELGFYFGYYREGWQYNQYGFLRVPLEIFLYSTGPVFTALSIAACLAACFTPSREIRLTLAGFLLHFVLIARSNTSIAKYYLVMLPFLAILNAHLFYALSQKMKRAGKIVSTALLAVLLFDTVSLTLAYNRVLLQKDARDEASEWIRKNIPLGSRIGVLREPYYQSPPVLYNQYFFTGKSKAWKIPEVYKIVNLEFDQDKIRQEKPDSLVVASRENRFSRLFWSRDLRPVDDWTPLEDFLTTEGYAKAAHFENRLIKNGRPVPRSFIYDDFEMILSEIRIYRLKA